LRPHRASPEPDQALALGITGNPLEKEFVSEGIYADRIQERELEFERPIRDAVMPLEEGQHLF
jgi:hypothetical protein